MAHQFDNPPMDNLWWNQLLDQTSFSGLQHDASAGPEAGQGFSVDMGANRPPTPPALYSTNWQLPIPAYPDQIYNQPTHTTIPALASPTKHHCPIPGCPASYTHAGDLARHQREKHGPSAKNFLCPVDLCPKSIPSNGFDRMHRLVAHLRSKRHGMDRARAEYEAAKGNPKNPGRNGGSGGSGSGHANGNGYRGARA